MQQLTTQNFEEIVLQSDKPVLVDFWATWCGPCQMMAPVIQEIETEHPDILVGKINVDEEADLAIQYKVASIPTLLLFKGGEIISKVIGFSDKETICQQLGL